jgi:DHA1 family inner membrane transport protein
MSVPMAAVAVRWPRRLVVTGLLGAYCLSNVVFAAAPNYAVAMAARVLGGLAHAGFFAVAVATAVSLVDRARSGRVIAVLMVGNALALLGGVPLGTILGTALGWRWTFALLAALTGLLAIAAFVVLPLEHPSAAAARTSVLTGLRRRPVLLVSAVITLLALGHFTLYTYISPLLLHDRFGHVDVGYVLFAYGAGGLLGLAAASAVVARWPEQALMLDCLLMGISLLLAAVLSSPSLVVVAVVVLWGIAFGALPTLTQTVALRAARDATDTATALVNATTNVGIAGGALVGGGLLRVVAVPTLGWVGAALVASSIVVYGVTLGQIRRAR